MQRYYKLIATAFKLEFRYAPYLVASLSDMYKISGYNQDKNHNLIDNKNELWHHRNESI